MKRLGWISLLMCLALYAVPAWSENAAEGTVTTPDGVELYYVRRGTGAETVILPARLFTFDDLQWLSERYTLISYDMRNRGRSSRVEDLSKISLEADVRDLETIRQHFGVEKFHTIGYSYLGLMVMLYAMERPERIGRVVQLGPVALKFGTEFKPEYVMTDRQQVIEQHGGARLRELREKNYHTTNPREYCEEEWKVIRYMLIGDPALVDRLGKGLCDLPNEWPVNLARHMQQHFVGSVQKLDVPRERAAQLRIPVLTIHGTRDRNASYGGGRDWVYLLPNARLLTIEGAAHQSFSERPDIVRPAITEFLRGDWPKGAEDVTEDPRK